ncbi:MAG: hypothetical protein ABEI96_00360 [Haloarculaceae archaeon]
MTLAADTREAVRERPFLLEALRAGVLNYSAAARFLGVADDDVEAVVAALGRYAEDVSDYAERDRNARVTMQSGLGRGDPDEALVVVGDAALVPGEGTLTAIQATGEVGPAALGRVLRRLAAEGVRVEVAAAASDVEETGKSTTRESATDEPATDGVIVVGVDRRDGANALRFVEGALDAMPDPSSTES